MQFSANFNGWFAMLVAIIFGVIGTVNMKLMLEKKQLYILFIIIISYFLVFIAMTFALQYIDLSVLYAVWSGVGTFLVSMIGIFYFKESLSLRKFIFLIFIIFGVIGMHIGD